MSVMRVERVAPGVAWLRRTGATFVAATTVLALLTVFAVWGFLHREDANVVELSAALSGPGAGHLFGTDEQGRDVLLRIAVGTGLAIVCGLVAVAVSATLGVLIAISVSYGPRWLDAVVMRCCDAVLAFPPLLLALAFSLALGVSLVTALVGVVVTIVPVFAKTLRAEAMRSRREPFVEAAHTIGLSVPAIAVRHVVPYLSTTLAVQAAANFGNVILMLAGLSFIGVGAQPPTPELGAMLTDGLRTALTGQWWVGVFPGVVLLTLVAAVNLIADRLPALVNGGGR